MLKVIGTCSNCNGPVEQDDGDVKNTPKCADCGRTPKEPFGRTIEMNESVNKDEKLLLG